MKLKQKSEHTSILVCVCLLVIGALLCFIVHSQKKKSKKEDFHTLNKKIVYVYSESCPHCQRFSNTFEKLKESTPNVEFESYERSDPQAARFLNHINGFPTVLSVDNDNMIINKLVGNVPLHVLQEFVENN